MIGTYLGILLAPSSRALLVGSFLTSNAEAQLRKISFQSVGATLPKPDSPQSASLWVRLFEKKVVLHRKISERELQTIKKLCKSQSLLDIDNGFWKQALAIAAWKLGDTKTAIKYWILASHDLNWRTGESKLINSPQNYPDFRAIDAVRIRLMRNAYSELSALWFARKLVSYTWFLPEIGNEVRFACVRNGELIRRHSRTLQGMDSAIAICDLSLLPPGTSLPSGHHELLIARIDLANLAQKTGNSNLSREIQSDFEENDSALALTSRQDNLAIYKRLVIEAAVVDSLPGTLLVTSLIAMFFLSFGALYRFLLTKFSKNKLIGATILSTLIIILNLLMGLSLATITLVLALFFGTLSPQTVRSSHPKRIGPLFELACFTLATLTIFSLLFYAIENSGVYKIISSSFQVNPFETFFGSIQIILAILFLFGPLWAFAQRVNTSFVIGKGIQIVSQTLIVISLFGTLITVPLCVHFDHRLQKPLKEIAENEPLYYILQ